MAMINIGSRKQLFVDDYIIESTTHTMRVMNPAEKVENNPVLRPEHPWEGNTIRVNRVFFDEKDGVFKMWYTAQRLSARRVNGRLVQAGQDTTVTCLATSEDGVNWEKPSLGLVEFDGSKENNIIPPSNVIFYFFQDLHEEDPAKRYKGLHKVGHINTRGMTVDLFYSPDGFDWTPYENNPVIDTGQQMGRWGPTMVMGWDPIRQVYAVHMENSYHQATPLSRRVIGRTESPDLIHWSQAETILVPDEQDTPDTEFYSFPVMAYEGIYVGMLWIFRTTNVTHHPEIVFSRDGSRYQRSYREPFISRGGKGDFDNVSIYVQDQVVHGDRIFTYYSGWNWRSEETLQELGDRAVGAVGLAVTPLDGFVSLDGGKGWAESGEGHPVVEQTLRAEMGSVDYAHRRSQGPPRFSEMVTRSFTFSGERLHVNMWSSPAGAGPHGCQIRVEVLGPNHEVLPGFGFEDADPMTESGLDRVVSWKGSSDVSRLAGEPIKLRFYFKNAKLYSFQFR